MKRALTEFHRLIKDISNTDAIYNYIVQVNVPIDSSDLLRWEWVQSVSAFDKFMHDIVLDGMLEIFSRIRVSTKKYQSYQLDMKKYDEMTSSGIDTLLVFKSDIVRKNGYKSFQDPKNVADALSYIWNENDKWKAIATKVGMTKENCVTEMKNIVLRRNQIAHEGDYLQNARQDILKSEVEGVKQFIKEIANAIYVLVTQTDNYVGSKPSTD